MRPGALVRRAASVSSLGTRSVGRGCAGAAQLQGRPGGNRHLSSCPWIWGPAVVQGPEAPQSVCAGGRVRRETSLAASRGRGRAPLGGLGRTNAAVRSAQAGSRVDPSPEMWSGLWDWSWLVSLCPSSVFPGWWESWCGVSPAPHALSASLLPGEGGSAASDPEVVRWAVWWGRLPAPPLGDSTPQAPTRCPRLGGDLGENKLRCHSPRCRVAPPPQTLEPLRAARLQQRWEPGRTPDMGAGTDPAVC